MERVAAFLLEFWVLTVAMAPYLLLGFVVAGLLKAFVPEAFVHRQLGKDNVWSVVKAALLGAPLPLCSCSVLPVAAELKRAGASRPAILTFLISTPVTGVDSVLATYALMGGFMAWVRPVMSVLVSLIAGLVLLVALRGHSFSGPDSRSMPPPDVPRAWWSGRRWLGGMAYAFGDLMAGMARPLLVGLAISAVITLWVPQDWVEMSQDFGPLTYVVVVLIGVPMYICATGSIPIAAALMLKGLSPGAALAFLIAGPATNAVALSVAKRVVGRRGFLVYVLAIPLGAIAAGLLTDVLYVAVGSPAPVLADTHAHQHGAVAVMSMVLSAGLLGFLFWHGLLHPLMLWWRSRQPVSEAGSGFPVVKLSVPSASCVRCSANITSSLRSIDAVRGVEVDLARKLVTVELQGSVDVDELRGVLKKAGYRSKVVREGAGTMGSEQAEE